MPTAGINRQFSLAYLLGEITLVAIALAAARVLLFPSAIQLETQAACFCIALITACGAIGGLCLRMTVGLIVGAGLVFAATPFLWIAITTASC